jgi:hypothetical protein
VALDGTVRLAFFPFIDVGEKTAWTVQVDDGAIVWPEQLSFCLMKSPGFVPVRIIVPIIRFAVPVFVTVKVCAADELPTSISPKL